MKNYLSIIFAVLITVSALTGCAGQNVSSEGSNAVGQNSEFVMNQADAQTDENASPIIPANAATSADYARAYEKLIAYKTGDYGQQSIADFHAALAPTPDELLEVLAAMADVTAGISPDDENYDFLTTTMNFTTNELYCEHMGEETGCAVYLSKQSRPCDYLDEDGETVYEFYCFVSLWVDYSIDNSKLVTVAERDKALLTYQEEMQNYLDSLSETEIADDNIKKMFTEKSAELEKRLSTENMKLLPCEIWSIEIIGDK